MRTRCRRRVRAGSSSARRLRARVFSTYLWALQGATPFGSLLMGWIAQSFGTPTAALIAGAVCFLTPLIIHLRTTKLRAFEDR